MPSKILLVEDHFNTVQSISKGMKENNIQVEIAYDGKTGSDLAISENYDVIISDVVMPEMTGIELCRFLRQHGVQTPVLLLSALDSTDMKITGLESGGDDYMTKPFEFKELLARVRALHRRKKGIEVEDIIIVVGDMIVNTHNKTVFRNGVKIELTPKEFKLLEYLAQKKGQVANKAELVENVWEIHFDPGTNVVEVYINYLRNKIDKGFSKKLIHNRSGIGYYIKD
ncbi:MAG: response regulator transcription factor [Saprospiraceae bacterium]|nr:response regulator transcription factor [Saprospiraceae bacterium]